MKKFFEYSNLNGYPTVNEVVFPYCPSGEDSPNVFLVYAKNKNSAFGIAMDYLYEGKPMSRFYGTYNGEKYCGTVKCVM